MSETTRIYNEEGSAAIANGANRPEPNSETAELARAKVLLRRVYEVLPVGTYHDADLYSDITDFLEIEPPQ